MPGSESGKKKMDLKQSQGQRDEADEDDDAEELLGEGEEEDEDYELDQEQIIQTILALGNEIWRNFGQEQQILDYTVFFQHQFYIQCFQMAYPAYDFSDLVKATDGAEGPEQMAACIQALINLLSEEILMYDMNHICGDEIVNGNPEHCINLLQILQQISSASMMQEGSGDGSGLEKSDSQPSVEQHAQEDDDDQPSSSPDKLPRSNSYGAGGSNSGKAPKSGLNAADPGNDDRQPHQNDPSQGPMFDVPIDNIEGLDGAGGNAAFLPNSSNKHQFLDNLDDDIGMNDEEEEEHEIDEDPMARVRHMEGNGDPRQANANLGAATVGDALAQELDVEFEADIQDNLQNHQGRGSAGSGGSSEQEAAAQLHQNQKRQILDGEDNEYEEDAGIVDHQEVDLMNLADGNGGAAFMDDEPNDDEGLDADEDPENQLTRQPDNMANLQPQMENDFDDGLDDDDEDRDGNDDDDDDDLGELQDGSGQYGPSRSLLLAEQNLAMEEMHNLAEDKLARRAQGRAPHHAQEEGDDDDLDDDEDRYGDEQDLEDEEEEEAEDEDEQGFDDLQDFDAQLPGAAAQWPEAHQFGLGEDGYAMLAQEHAQQQAVAEGLANAARAHGQEPPSDEGDEAAEVQVLAEILSGVKAADGLHQDQGREPILGGGQNIEDDHQLEDEDDEDDEDEDEDGMEHPGVGEIADQLEDMMHQGDHSRDELELHQQQLMMMQQQQEAHQMQQMEEDDEGLGEDDDQAREAFADDDEQMIDTDNLDDHEKALLCRYLQAEYAKNPDSLPMPREVVEEFLARNQDLLDQQDNQDEDGSGPGEMPPPGHQDGLGDTGQESRNEGIDSNEIVVEGDADQDMGEGSEQDGGELAGDEDLGEQEDDEVEGEGEDDEEEDGMMQDPEGRYQEAMQRHPGLQVGEINIEGGEQNIDDEEHMAANGYVVQQHQDQLVYDQDGEEQDGLAVPGYGEEEEDDMGEEEDDQNQHQIFNPQYPLDEIQEVDQDDGNGLMIQNINLQAQQPGNLTEEQMQQLFHHQQLQMQQLNLQQQALGRKPAGKKKKLTSAHGRKPPPVVHGSAFQRGSAAGAPGRLPATTASKRYRKGRPAGHTISHDDEHQIIGGRQPMGLEVGSYGGNRSAQRRPNSHKRPQTAKPRKAFGVAGPAAKRRSNNYLGAQPSGGFKGPAMSSTPSNRLRSGKALGAGAAGSLKNMIVPQQSQMFTSFGVPHGAMQSMSQRKAASHPKKRYQGLYGSVKGATSMSKKRSRVVSQASVPKLARNAKRSLKHPGQVPMQAQQPLQQQAGAGGPGITGATPDQAQNLVEMPILSEDFLNQLNEEQLQALLEQQQQLMMLQQQNQVQGVPENAGGAQNEGLEQQFPEEDLADGGLVHQQQQVAQKPFSAPAQFSAGGKGRGRSKAHAQFPGAALAARIPSAGRKATVPASAGGARGGSGSRSAHGSRKRTQKTRSSLNVASSGPLSLGAPLANPGLPAASSSNAIFRSQKLAAQIYGSSADSMLQNLISQRKKGGKAGKKRSQPNQAGKALAQQLSQMQQSAEPYDLQAQLLAQQAQYNKLLAQQQAAGSADQLGANLGHPQYNQALDDLDGMDMQGSRQGVHGDDAEGVITEASPDQEDGESQSQFNQMSQQHRQQLMMQVQQQQMGLDGGGGQSNIQPLQGQISNIADDLSTEQIIELLQNAADAQNSQNGEMDEEGDFDEHGAPINQNQGQQLPEEIQIQLQQVLQERMLQQQQQQFLLQQQQMLNANVQAQGKPQLAEAIAGMALNDRVQSYQNICNILTESVTKARQKHQHMVPSVDPRRAGAQSSSGSPQRAPMPMPVAMVGPMSSMGSASGAGKLAGPPPAGPGGKESIEADQRILKQKKQFESLLKQYRMDLKLQETKRQQDLRRAEKIALREDKIKQMRQKKFEEGMISQQRSQIIKRNAQQARLCKKVFKLASDLEKDKLIEEKKHHREQEHQKVSQKRAMVETIENYYKDKIDMLKDRIGQEKFERHVAQEAQKKALSQMKKELGDQKRKEVERYIRLLQQEDEKFDLENLNASRLEHEIVRLYQKK